jgi:hypothetical protein
MVRFPKLARVRCSLAWAVGAAAAFGFLTYPGISSAEIYGWVDGSGAVTYSNLPPPKGARLTDLIHEDPPSPQAVAESTHRAEVSALNDRIRLLELEMARAKRESVDYPAPPVAPAGPGCGPDGYADCNGPWGPYYTTGILYGTGRAYRDGRSYGHGGAHPYRPSGQAPAAPMRLTRAASMHGGSPVRSR